MESEAPLGSGEMAAAGPGTNEGRLGAERPSAPCGSPGASRTCGWRSREGKRSLSLVSGLCSAVHGRGEGHGGHPWRRWNREHGLCFRVSVQPTRVGLGRGDQKSVPSRARGQAGSAAQSSANGAQCLPVALLQLPVPAPVLRARGRARPEASSETAVAPGSTWARAAPSSASSPWSAVTRSPHVQHTWKGFEI